MPNKNSINGNSSPTEDTFIIIVIAVRVFVVLVLWLAMFLTIFLGYFTVPFILMVLITAIFLISDLSLFTKLKRRKKDSLTHHEFLEDFSDGISQKKNE